MNAELEGYAWVPRMLAKARLALAGDTTYLFGCPVDHTCMARLGIGPELVSELAGRHADDAVVLDELRARGIPSASEAWFDGQGVEDEMQDTGFYLKVRPLEGFAEDAGDDALVAVLDGEATFFLGRWQARTVRAGEVVRIPHGAERALMQHNEPQ
ncbi:MAG: DUF5069 domain-containing protein [Solirubrobacteraceae bacterium]